MWECKLTRGLRSLCIPNLLSLFNLCKENWGTQDYWSYNTNEEKLYKVLLIMWNVWSVKNKFSANKATPNPNQILRQVKLSLIDQIEARSTNLRSQSVKRCRNRPSHYGWKKLQANSWKMNSDVTWNRSSKLRRYRLGGLSLRRIPNLLSVETN